MLKYFIIYCLLISNIAFGKSIMGEGRFWAKDEDKLEFIKKQLEYEAMSSILSQELESMGLNKELFWQKYNEAFEKSFEATDTAYKEKYAIDTDSATRDQKKTYNKIIRKKRLKRKRLFKNLKNVVQAYTVKRFSRSSKHPQSRFMRIEATKIDRNRLSKIYYNLIRGKQSSDYGSLFLNVNYDLQNCSFTDLGVENAKDFTNVINEYWLKWFSNDQNRPKNISNVAILSESDKEKLKEYQSYPLDKMLENTPERFVNSLVLQVNVKIVKKKYDKIFNDYEFKFEGGYFLQDLQTNLVLAEGTLGPENQTYTNVTLKRLMDGVGNHLYRLPLGKFTSLKKSVEQVPPVNFTRIVTIFDYKNLNEVDGFIKLIKEKGIKNSLNTNILSLENNKAKLAVFFDGEFSELKALLKGQEAAKRDLTYEFIDSDDALGIKFKRQVITNF